MWRLLDNSAPHDVETLIIPRITLVRTQEVCVIMKCFLYSLFVSKFTLFVQSTARPSPIPFLKLYPILDGSYAYGKQY
jgi:hypothetical protein